MHHSFFQDVLHLTAPAFIGGLCNIVSFRMCFIGLCPILSTVYATRCLSRCTSSAMPPFIGGLWNTIAFRMYFTWLRPLLSVVYASRCLSGCTSPDSARFYRWFMQHHVFQDVLHLSPPAFICGLCNKVSFRMYFTWVHMLFIDDLCSIVTFRMYFTWVHMLLSMIYVA
jgi:hypothetical protein